MSVQEGQPATLSVSFEGSPPPAVKWFRYSFQVKDSDEFRIRTTDTGSSLTVSHTCTDDSGLFTCLIENIAGSCKSSANLDVVEGGSHMMEASVVSKRTLKEMTVNQVLNSYFVRM